MRSNQLNFQERKEDRRKEKDQMLQKLSLRKPELETIIWEVVKPPAPEVNQTSLCSLSRGWTAKLSLSLWKAKIHLPFSNIN